jgi:hypothetical protein
MSKAKPSKTVDRRGFLKSIGTGAAGAATVAAGVTAATPALAAESAADKKKVRYRESEHVKKYYATNRY